SGQRVCDDTVSSHELGTQKEGQPAPRKSVVSKASTGK
ncbi:hypothetical protein FOPG_19951, partial [Fusarium oxysporum f. sp. conglutinans race 2 54008]